MRGPDVLETIGAALVVAGCALIVPWLAFVVAGLALILKAFVVEHMRPRCVVKNCEAFAAQRVQGVDLCREHAEPSI